MFERERERATVHERPSVFEKKERERERERATVHERPSVFKRERAPVHE